MGLTLSNKERILKQLASVAGEPFSETNVAMDRDYILSNCQSAGYADAAFDFRTAPGPGEHEMSLEYDITPGRLQTRPRRGDYGNALDASAAHQPGHAS